MGSFNSLPVGLQLAAKERSQSGPQTWLDFGFSSMLLVLIVLKYFMGFLSTLLGYIFGPCLWNQAFIAFFKMMTLIYFILVIHLEGGLCLKYLNKLKKHVYTHAHTEIDFLITTWHHVHVSWMLFFPGLKAFSSLTKPFLSFNQLLPYVDHWIIWSQLSLFFPSWWVKQSKHRADFNPVCYK